MFGTECDLIGKTPRCTFGSKQNRIVLNANIPESHFQNCNFRILCLQERLSTETITLGIGPKLQIPQETFFEINDSGLHPKLFLRVPNLYW